MFVSLAALSPLITFAVSHTDHIQTKVKLYYSIPDIFVECTVKWHYKKI